MEKEMEVKWTAPSLARAWRRSVGVTLLLCLCCCSAAQAQNSAPAGSTPGEENGPAGQRPAAEEKGADRLSALRAQIAGAKTDTERLRLQRTLVNYLVALNKREEAVS